MWTLLGIAGIRNPGRAALADGSSRLFKAGGSFATVSPMPDSGLPSLRGVKVLVVEDDEATRYILSKQLETTGAIVTAVEDARQAVEVLRSEAIDVLLTDILLRDGNGLHLLASIPSRPPVAIAITAFIDDAPMERALSAGFNLYLPKPVDPVVLAQEIAQRIGSR
jgi:CheY-like chemotaxis protein